MTRGQAQTYLPLTFEQGVAAMVARIEAEANA